MRRRDRRDEGRLFLYCAPCRPALDLRVGMPRCRLAAPEYLLVPLCERFNNFCV